MLIERWPTLKGADAVYCPQCAKVIGDRCQVFWSMNKTKGLHEKGIHHKPYYVKLVLPDA